MAFRILGHTLGLPSPGVRRGGALLAAGIVALALVRPVTQAQESKKPLSKDDVLKLLHGEVAPGRVAYLAREKGISFPMTPDNEKELRKSGADEGLIKVLRELAPPPPATGTLESSASPVLMVQSTPGGAQVYVDDEPVGTTSSEGRLKLSRLTAGEHHVRVSLSGYADYEQTVQLTAGQTVKVAPTLQGGSTAGTSSAPPPPASQVAASLTSSAPSQTPAASPALPTFLVVHDHGQGVVGTNYCVGNMMIGNGLISYKGSRGAPVHSLDIQVSAVKEAKKNGAYLVAIGGFHIRLKKGTNYNFVVINDAAQFQPPDALLDAIDGALRTR